jgi:hypothetical protein
MQSDRPHTTTATTYQTQLRPTFVLYGDSLTQFSFNMGGWGAGVACRYQVPCPSMFSLPRASLSQSRLVGGSTASPRPPPWA